MKHVAALFAAAALAAWPSFAFADVVSIEGVAEGYFPYGRYEVPMETQQIKSYAHADEEDMVFFTLTVFKDHGQTPSPQWFSRFVKGQETTVSDAVSGVNQVDESPGKVEGEYFLEGLLQGVRYEKVCTFTMNQNDYGSWCVAVLGDGANQERAVNDYIEHSSNFQLLD